MSSVARYDVFLSHNSADKAAVEALAQKLQAAGFAPFLDKWHLIPGDPWQEALEQALDQSRTCAVFLGPKGVGSWENEEMRLALDTRTQAADFRVIPVLLPGTPMPERGRLPRFLSRLTWVDFRQGIDDADAFYHLTCGIRGVAPGAPGAVERPVAELCPYRGLQAFHEEHAEFFFGRDALTQWLVEGLRASRFLAVIGPSGSGKSSAVRAGLAPALRRRALPGSAAWTIVTMRPGPHPLEELAAQFAGLPSAGDRVGTMLQLQDNLRKDTRALHTAVRLLTGDSAAAPCLLLIVDQFEEIFTLCPDEAERRCFLNNLLYASGIAQGRTAVVLTLRADFYARAATYPELADCLADHQVLVTPMQEDELRQAIVTPAQRVGLAFDPGLVETILADVLGEPGALPLLEHALLELWQRRQGRQLTLAAYHEIGGVKGAIARRAEEEYGALTPEQQTVARRILLRLVQPGEGAVDTRRRARFDELAPDPEHAPAVAAVVQRLANARLLTTGRNALNAEEMIDVAHEALIQGWPRLHDWIERDREALRTQRRLADAAIEWYHQNQDASYLYRGARLATAEEWAKRHTDDLSQAESAFLNASLTLRDRETALEEAQFRRDLEHQRELAREAEARRAVEEQRANDAAAHAKKLAEAATRLRQRAILAGLLGMAAVVLAVFAFMQFGNANEERNNAWLAATAEAKAVQASMDLAEARATAVAVAESERDGARESLSRQLAAQFLSTLELGQLTSGSDLLLPIKDISLLLALEAFHTADTPESTSAMASGLYSHYPLARILRGNDARVDTLAFSPDGRLLATGSRNSIIILWDTKTGQKVRTLLADEGGSVSGLAFNPTGEILASGFSYPVSVILWDVNTGQRVREPLLGHADQVSALAFSPEGGLLATGDYRGSIILWDVENGQAIGVPLSAYTDTVQSLAFSSDGGLLASSGGAGNLVLWDVATGLPFREPAAITDMIGQNVIFGLDSKILFATNNNEIRRWNIVTGHAIDKPLYGHEKLIRNLVVSANSQTLVSASESESIVWNLTSDPPRAVQSYYTGSARVEKVALSPDGKLLATVHCMEEKPGGAYVLNLPICTKTETRLWDLIRDDVLGQSLARRTIGSFTHAAVFRPDNKTFVTVDNGDRITIWDAATAQPISHPVAAHRDWVTSLHFSPDGEALISIDTNHNLIVWNVTNSPATTLKIIGTAVDTRAVGNDAQGAVLALVKENGVLRIWDVMGTRTIGQSIPADVQAWEVSASPDLETVVIRDKSATYTLWHLDGKQPRRQQLAGHTRNLRNVVFNRAGSLLAAVDDSGAVFLWDTGSRRRITPIFTDHSVAAEQLAFNPLGGTLAIVDTANRLHLWNVDTEQMISEPLAMHKAKVEQMVFDPQGRFLATRDADDLIVLYDLKRIEPVGQPISGTALAFSPDGRTLASGDHQGTVRLWNAATVEPLVQPLTGHSASVEELLFAQGDRLLLASADQNEVILWDIAGVTPISKTLTGHNSGVIKLAFDPSGSKLATGSQNGTVSLWNVNTGQLIGRTPEGQKAFSTAAVLSPDGHVLALRDSDGTITLRDVETDRLLGHLYTQDTDFGTSLTFSPDSREIVSAPGATSGTDEVKGEIQVWDVKTAKLKTRLPVEYTGSRAVLSPDGRMLALYGREETITLWNVETGQPWGDPLVGHANTVTSVAFDPKGATLASGDRDGRIILWDLADQPKMRLELWYKKAVVGPLVFSSDGILLASVEQTLADSNETADILLWDVTAGRLLTKIPMGSTADPLNSMLLSVHELVFSLDGKRLFVVRNDGAILTLNTATGALLDYPLNPRFGWVVGPLGTSIPGPLVSNDTLGRPFYGEVVFSPDQHFILSWDHSIEAPIQEKLFLWDLNFESWQTRLCAIVNRNLTWQEWNAQFRSEPYRKTCPDLPVHPSVVDAGKVLAAYGDLEGARIHFMKLLQTEPELVPPGITAEEGVRWLVARALIERGAFAANAEEIESATALFRLAMAQDPSYRFDAATEWQMLKESVQADPEHYTEIMEASPIWAIGRAAQLPEPGMAQPFDPQTAVRQFLAQAALEDARKYAQRWGDSEAAKQKLQEAVEMDPSLNLDPEMEVRRLNAARLLRQGQELARSGDVAGALAQFQQARDLDPGLALNPQVEAQKLAGQGKIQEAKAEASAGNIENAVAILREALVLAPNLNLDPETEARRFAAPAFMKAGRDLARAGDVEGAMTQFTQALELDPGLNLDPRSETLQLAVPNLIQQGINLLDADDTEGARTLFQRVLKLNPLIGVDPQVEIREQVMPKLLEEAAEQAKAGNIEGASFLLKQALELDPSIDVGQIIQDQRDGGEQLKYAMAAYATAQELDMTLNMPADSWNSLCWRGSLYGYAAEVLSACEQAVRLAPDDGGIRDSRGLARALLGDFDGAVEDFQFAVEYWRKTGDYWKYGPQREEWIAALQAGKQPFDEQTLGSLQP